MEIIRYQNFDEERALYGVKDVTVAECTFDGPADGESALKEAAHVTVEDCTFRLRYPFWHTRDFVLRRSTMTDTCRAPLWYAENGVIEDCTVEGVKCLRECDGMTLRRMTVKSEEFGWRCRGLTIEESDMEAVYFLFECRDVTVKNLTMRGKYSFQYVENMTIEDSVLDTKDAFWHAKNVTVKNSVVKGEYLGWYSENLTLINCKISGTQPFCYCKNLTLIDCETDGCDLAFERSTVNASVKGNIVSVKNPISGRITADSIGEVIREFASDCVVEVREE
ncbi:MAG: DUF3737 family protein [Clostridia bacterium]|nr:DUF3737 family protein [Clostridia bacterium]